MHRIEALSDRIRQYTYPSQANLYENHYKQHRDEWYLICAAMDALGDTCLALGHFEAGGIRGDFGEKYLKLYGVLQAVFLQQDSIRYLYSSFGGTPLETASDSKWQEIRELRNLTVGHPLARTAKSRTKRSAISRISIEDKGFTLMIWSKELEKAEFVEVDLRGLYEGYKLEAIVHLERLYQSMLTRWSI